MFENIISFDMDLFQWSRKKSTFVSAVLIILLSMPCVLGFNVLAGFEPLGSGTNIMDLEDFIVSNNVLICEIIIISATISPIIVVNKACSSLPLRISN